MTVYLLRVMSVNPGVRARMRTICVTLGAISKPSLNESSLNECVSIGSEWRVSRKSRACAHARRGWHSSLATNTLSFFSITHKIFREWYCKECLVNGAELQVSSNECHSLRSSVCPAWVILQRVAVYGQPKVLYRGWILDRKQLRIICPSVPPSYVLLYRRRATAVVARPDIMTNAQGHNVLSCEVYIFAYFQKIHTYIMILLKIYY